jgi:hypothetical protein
VGKGEAWFDDFVLTINGQNAQFLQEVEKELTKAQLDKEFDSGSLIEINELSPKTIANLALLGRVWGFLKYHHPEITKGNYNWDYELFRFLPDYLLVDDNPGGLRTMISGIGVYYPNGEETQRVGIIPEIKVEPTIEQ